MNTRRATTLFGVIGTLMLLVGCRDGDPAGVHERVFPPGDAGPTASNPLAAPAASRVAAHLAGGASGEDVVYVSFPPGTVPDGGLATIRNTRTGESVPTPMTEGGFDPVAIPASVGDALTVEVERAGGGTVSFTLRVPERARPIVVRTEPPPGRRDVALNARIVVVFSEPIEAGTEAGVTLTRAGAPVSGRATLSAEGLRAEFQTSGLLARNTRYAISVSTGVTDLSGDALAQPVAADFTTGTTQIAASVATDPAALFTNPFNGELRAQTMSAIRTSDGHVSGSFNIFYPGPGYRMFGRVTCFTIVGGSAVWVAGVVESANDTSAVGLDVGWLAVDNGPPESGVPDQLSLGYPLADSNLGTAQDFCANTPVSEPIDGQIVLYDLLSGDIVVNGSGPPPPPPSRMSEIAFADWPNGGIQVVNADGSGGRVLSSDSGDFSPAWSPDGSKLAFDRNRGDQFAGDIYVINADGSGLKRLTADGADDSDPAWSPNGGKIAFGRNGAIYVMNASDGSGVRALTSGGCDFHPTWSPDGSRIAFASCRIGTNGIYVMATDGTSIRRITQDSVIAYSPWWSPDGGRIAFERGVCCSNAVYVVNPDGTGFTEVAIHGRTPSWSPDGRAVVFEWFGLNVANADGTGLHALGNGFDPAWSPTGTMPPLLQPAASVEVEPAVDTLAVGDTVRVTAIVKDAAGNVLPGRLAAWAISDSTVAATNPGYGRNRLVTGVGPGTAWIAAMIDGKSDTAVVVVRTAP